MKLPNLPATTKPEPTKYPAHDPYRIEAVLHAAAEWVANVVVPDDPQVPVPFSRALIEAVQAKQRYDTAMNDLDKRIRSSLVRRWDVV